MHVGSWVLLSDIEVYPNLLFNSIQDGCREAISLTEAFAACWIDEQISFLWKIQRW